MMNRNTTPRFNGRRDRSAAGARPIRTHRRPSRLQPMGDGSPEEAAANRRYDRSQ